MIRKITRQLGWSALAFFLAPRQSTLYAARVDSDAKTRLYPIG
jgi:hypothetical protein